MKMTKNKYQEFLKANASRLYNDKDYTMDDYDKDSNSIEIIPFEINTLSNDLKNIVNMYCNTEEKREGNTLYRGFTYNQEATEIKIKKALNCEVIYFGAYQSSFKCDELLTLIEFTEGDVTINICDTIDKYSEEVERYQKFYKENC